MLSTYVVPYDIYIKGQHGRLTAGKQARTTACIERACRQQTYTTSECTSLWSKPVSCAKHVLYPSNAAALHSEAGAGCRYMFNRQASIVAAHAWQCNQQPIHLQVL